MGRLLLCGRGCSRRVGRGRARPRPPVSASAPLASGYAAIEPGARWGWWIAPRRLPECRVGPMRRGADRDAEAAADDRRGDRRVSGDGALDRAGNLTRIGLGKLSRRPPRIVGSGVHPTATALPGSACSAMSDWAADQPAPRLWTVPARRAMMIGKRGSARLRRHMMKKRSVRSALSAARDAAAAPRAGETRVGTFTVSDPGLRDRGAGSRCACRARQWIAVRGALRDAGFAPEAMPRGGSLADGGLEVRRVLRGVVAASTPSVSLAMRGLGRELW